MSCDCKCDFIAGGIQGVPGVVGLGDAALCDLGCLCSVGSERWSMPVTGNVCKNILKSQTNAVHFCITMTGVWLIDDQFLNSHSNVYIKLYRLLTII